MMDTNTLIVDLKKNLRNKPEEKNIRLNSKKRYRNENIQKFMISLIHFPVKLTKINK